MKQYEVTGMSCAACSARVEKAVSKIEGVTSCSVNLLTNSMGVEGAVDAQTVIEAVEAAGYKAAEKESRTGQEAGRMEKSGELKAIDRLSLFFDSVNVSVNGAYDVGMESSGNCERESRGNGDHTASADNSRNGDQSEVFYQWSQRTFS